MVIKCIIKSCKRLDKLHSFPKESKEFYDWCVRIGYDLKLENRKKYRICDLHFDETMKFEQFRKRSNLIKGAYPTLHFDVPMTREVCDVGNSTPVEQTAACESLVSSTTTIDTSLQLPLYKKQKDGMPTCVSDFKNLDLLSFANVRFKSQLSPRARRLLNVAANAVKVIKKLDTANTTYKQLLEQANTKLQSLQDNAKDKHKRSIVSRLNKKETGNMKKIT